jgi:hypothetical protein
MKIFRRVLIFISMLLMLSQWCLGVYFAAKAPTKPDYRTGTIYPVRIHQSVVYITAAETYYYNDWILALSFYCGAPVVLYELWAQRKRVKERLEELPPER